jgi:hypothetical protein
LEAVLPPHDGPAAAVPVTDVQELLPATVSPGRVALAGPHAWAEEGFRNVASWGIQLFSPSELCESTRPLLQILTAFPLISGTEAELTCSDWTRLVNPAETEDRRPGQCS